MLQLRLTSVPTFALTQMGALTLPDDAKPSAFASRWGFNQSVCLATAGSIRRCSQH